MNGPPPPRRTNIGGARKASLHRQLTVCDKRGGMSVNETLTKSQAELLIRACERGHVEVSFNPPSPRYMAEKMVKRGLLEKIDTLRYKPTTKGIVAWPKAIRVAGAR